MTWTVDEAVRELDPAMTTPEVRAMILCFRIPPIGHRRAGRGRPAPEYRQEEILRAHADLAPWLVATPSAEAPPPGRPSSSPARETFMAPGGPPGGGPVWTPRRGPT
ncbi:hypothetical protein ACGFIV_00875 [Sphaerisporangium sp. NPDC049003]|uniref:hypothetical protein n=1 Tax=Sphaerisporangium sp. NPDC049003 TaxID=3364517 RepID=UPI00372396CC